MQSINDLKAKQAKELAALEEQHKFAAYLPVMPSFMNLKAGDGAPEVRYNVVGFGGALEVVKGFTIAQFTEFRDGLGLHLRPTALCRGIDKDKYADQFAASIQADTSFSSETEPQTSIKFRFYARVPGFYQAGQLVHVVLHVEGPDYIGNHKKLAASCDFNSRGSHILAGSVRPNAALNGYGDRFISWSVPGNRALHEFLFCGDYADQDLSGPKELSHLYAQLQNMADEFDAKEAV